MKCLIHFIYDDHNINHPNAMFSATPESRYNTPLNARKILINIDNHHNFNIWSMDFNHFQRLINWVSRFNWWNARYHDHGHDHHQIKKIFKMPRKPIMWTMHYFIVKNNHSGIPFVIVAHLFKLWSKLSLATLLKGDAIVQNSPFRSISVRTSGSIFTKKHHRLRGIGIPIIKLKRFDDRHRFIIGIPRQRWRYQ